MTWENELHVAQQAALEAGKTLNRLFGKKIKIEKKGRTDLVTEADLQAESLIVEIIRGHFPKDTIITEEAGKTANDPERVWIIDPLDGTTNFAHHFSFFAVSIALEVEGVVVLGVVSNPVLGEFFEAVKGRGATLNKNRIEVSQTCELKESLLSTGFPYNVDNDPQKFMKRFTKMMLCSQGIRRPGSAAIDLCYVAAGIFDGFWEEGLQPWDTAAGIVIVEEAGGKVTSFGGEASSPFSTDIVASNTRIHADMLEALNAPG